jgi:hypothetical protein
MWQAASCRTSAGFSTLDLFIYLVIYVFIYGLFKNASELYI